jgi:hypothetical protein
MVIVEQSLNVALAVADRAVFMEKGQIRFDGPAQELAERDDLARAVFLGGAGGAGGAGGRAGVEPAGAAPRHGGDRGGDGGVGDGGGAGDGGAGGER